MLIRLDVESKLSEQLKVRGTGGPCGGSRLVRRGQGVAMSGVGTQRG